MANSTTMFGQLADYPLLEEMTIIYTKQWVGFWSLALMRTAYNSVSVHGSRQLRYKGAALYIHLGNRQ